MEQPQRRDVLTRWKPGQSGNPGGRPRRKPITEAYRRIIENENLTIRALKQREEDSIVDALAKSMVMRSFVDVKAVAEVTDRIEGRVAPEQEDNPNRARMTVIFDIPRPVRHIDADNGNS
jgi:hypothetical protein